METSHHLLWVTMIYRAEYGKDSFKHGLKVGLVSELFYDFISLSVSTHTLLVIAVGPGLFPLQESTVIQFFRIHLGGPHLEKHEVS